MSKWLAGAITDAFFIAMLASVLAIAAAVMIKRIPIEERKQSSVKVLGSIEEK
ncbi:hypothetical protein [Mesoaciditoga lauensis]|uniref:hypothetical protein n=1 Tax=Mesoaciditoga lauensis TaxID=1495039 RepID=UPI0012E05EF2|nr:hypothetical protein [Mesoaciditoga lauensis]